MAPPAPGGCDRAHAYPRGTEPPPGTEQVGGWSRSRYELLGCVIHGHELVHPNAATTSKYPELAYREEPAEAFSWFRCLRCDAWLPLPEVLHPSASGDDVVGPLRDRFVLRLIAVDRMVHFLLPDALVAAIFLFAHDRQSLRGDHTVEAFGLGRARRGAEYLTLVEVAILVPVAVHELALRLSLLKILTPLINLAVDRDTGWEPLHRSTPWLMQPDPESPSVIVRR